MDETVAPPAPADDIFDAVRIGAEIDALAVKHAGQTDMLRTALAQYLKAELATARKKVEQTLLADRHGRRCAERLCFIMDEIIRLIFDTATRHLYSSTVLSEAERMTVVATGGYGRGLMAPESDIDLLFLLPYKQTARGEQIAEAILYCLWDMGLKVGHATRSIDECIRQARADMTIRTVGAGSRASSSATGALFDELVTRFDKDVVQGTAPEFVAAKLDRARGTPSPRRAVALSGRAQRQGRQGRAARPAHAVLDREVRLSRARRRNELVAARRVRPAGISAPSAAAKTFCGRSAATCTSTRAAPKSGCRFDIQREIAQRLGYTEHPGMQDVERFMKHYFLIAKDVGDLTAILCAQLEDEQAKPAPVLSRMMARLRPETRPTAAAGIRRFPRRQQPHHHRRAGCVPARSGQSDPHVPPGAEA